MWDCSCRRHHREAGLVYQFGCLMIERSLQRTLPQACGRWFMLTGLVKVVIYLDRFQWSGLLSKIEVDN
jgi:hypothetical protein